MNGGLYQITMEEFHDLVPVPDPALVRFAWHSSPLLAGVYGHSLVCMAGLVPESAISPRAYLWLHTFPALADHPRAFARHAKRFVGRALNTYPILFGHCATPSAIKWLTSLGATFTPTPNNIVQFEISTWTQVH